MLLKIENGSTLFIANKAAEKFKKTEFNVLRFFFNFTSFLWVGFVAEILAVPRKIIQLNGFSFLELQKYA